VGGEGWRAKPYTKSITTPKTSSQNQKHTDEQSAYARATSIICGGLKKKEGEPQFGRREGRGENQDRNEFGKAHGVRLHVYEPEAAHIQEKKGIKRREQGRKSLRWSRQNVGASWGRKVRLG